MFLFLFCFSISKPLIPSSNDIIPEPIVDIPVTIVFVGNHHIISHEILNTEFARNWFARIGHTSPQKVKNQTSYYVSSDVLKVPPLSYRYNFSILNLPEIDSKAFEEALINLARESKWKNGFKVIHPFPLQKLLNSLVEFYNIKNNYVFFLYATEHNNFQFCEGIDKSEFLEGKSPQSDFASPSSKIEPFNKSINWGKQIQESINKNFLGDWSNYKAVFEHLSSNEKLQCELKRPSTLEQCGNYWIMNENRVFFSDASPYARSSAFEESAEDSPSLSEKLSDSISSFDKICTKVENKFSSNFEYCTKFESYIADLRAQVSAIGSKKSSQVLQRFFSNTSAIILDALKTQVVPFIPSFDTPLPDVFQISITSIGKTPKSFNVTTLKKILDSYMLNKAIKAKYDFDSSQLIEWPMLAIPLQNATTTSSSSISSTSDDISSSIQKSVSSESLRESLQFKTLNHKLYNSDKNLNTKIRDVVSNVVFFNGSSILINGQTDFFAFDNVGLAIYKSNDIDKNKYFPPHSLLRATLVHMYGLSPTRRWRSLSIMCPMSNHLELNQISRDAAYRNSIWTEVSKTKVKIDKHFSRVMKVLQFSKQRSNNTINFSEDELLNEAKDVSVQMDETLRLASELKFEEMGSAMKVLRSSRKVLTKQLKSVVNVLEQKMCQHAPVNLVVKNSSLVDRLDTLAMFTFPLWMALLAVAIAASLFVITKRMKMN